MYLTAMLPRKERHHRCAALVTEYAAGGSLRDAVNRGAVHVPTATAVHAAAVAAGLGHVTDMSALPAQQLAVLVAQLEQQMPASLGLPQVPLRHSQDQLHMSALLPASAAAATAALGGLLGPDPGSGGGGPPAPPIPGVQPVRHLHDAATDQLREPYIPLLRTLLLHVALGMQHLHANGIVHGELRLDNVVIAGQLPGMVSLLQQQQQQQRLGLPVDVLPSWAEVPAAAAAATSPNHHQQQLGAGAGSFSSAAAELAEELAGRTNSSFGSNTPPETAHASGSSQVMHVGSFNSSCSSSGGGSGASSNGFVLKVKDIGLCTIGWSHRQV